MKMNFILIIAPAGSINNETVFVICSGCCFYHKSGTLKKGPMTIKKQLTEGLNGVVAFTVES